MRVRELAEGTRDSPASECLSTQVPAVLSVTPTAALPQQLSTTLPEPMRARDMVGESSL